MPFGWNCEYADFDACVADNQDKKNPEGFCAAIMQKTEGRCKKG